jgi:hypothetical protein
MLSKPVENIICNVCVIFFIAFFSYTAFNKLLEIQSFRNNLIKTGMFPLSIVPALSIAIIIIEIVVVFLLLFKKMIGLLVLFMMMLVFTVYISYLNHKGLYEICGCGGILNGLPYRVHLVINLVLAACSAFCLVQLQREKNEKAN